MKSGFLSVQSSNRADPPSPPWNRVRLDIFIREYQTCDSLFPTDSLGKTSKRMRSSAFLTYADYRILDFSLIISPSTANLPYP